MWAVTKTPIPETLEEGRATKAPLTHPNPQSHGVWQAEQPTRGSTPPPPSQSAGVGALPGRVRRLLRHWHLAESRRGMGVRRENKKRRLPRDGSPPLESLETAASRSAGISHTCGTKVTCAEGWDRVTPRGTGSSGRAPPSGDREEGGLVPYAASIRPVAGHAGGQQQGRHGLVEEEVVVDELLLLRFGHALERVIPA